METSRHSISRYGGRGDNPPAIESRRRSTKKSSGEPRRVKDGTGALEVSRNLENSGGESCPFDSNDRSRRSINGEKVHEVQGRRHSNSKKRPGKGRHQQDRPFDSFKQSSHSRSTSGRSGDGFIVRNGRQTGNQSYSTHSSRSNLRSLKDTIGLEDLPSSTHRSTFETQFDIDAGRRKAERRPSIGTVETNRGSYMTGEQRAWAGIIDILDFDDASVLTKDVLPGEILQAMNESISSMQSASVRLSSAPTNTTPPAMPEPQVDVDESSESSHESNMKKFCGYVEQPEEMPVLMESSFSSLVTESTIKTLLSLVSANNQTIQDDVTDDALKGFLGNITQVLERKKSHNGETNPDSARDPIFEMFTWSEKANVDQLRRAREEEKRKEKRKSRKERLSVTMNDANLETTIDYEHGKHTGSVSFDDHAIPEQDASYDSRDEPTNPTVDDESYPFDEEIQRTPDKVASSFNNSMPSLLSVKEPEIVQKSKHSALKWTSFGDLNYDAKSNALAPPPLPAETGTPTSPRKVKTVRIKVKKKKKKKKAKVKTSQAANADEPKIPPTEKAEDFKGFFPRSKNKETGQKKSERTRGIVKTLARSFSKQEVVAPPRNDKQNRYKESSNPFKVIRNRIPSLTMFGKTSGKNKRDSPTAIIDTGRQEAHFFDDFIEQDEEEWGGLLG